MTTPERARIALAMAEATVAMHRDSGDTKALRAAQGRVNGLRTKAVKLANAERALAEKRAWYKGAA